MILYCRDGCRYSVGNPVRSVRATLRADSGRHAGRVSPCLSNLNHDAGFDHVGVPSISGVGFTWL